MKTGATNSRDTGDSVPLRHWIWQTLPPLLLLSILFTTRSGSALVYLVGLLLLPVLFSLISMIAKLLRFRERRIYLLRPALTLAVFCCILGIAEWTYRDAERATYEIAQRIHQQCQRDTACPEVPSGWQSRDSSVRKDNLGRWLHYTAMYRSEADRFTIRLYRGPDTGAVIDGGAGRNLEISAYRDDHQRLAN